MEQIQIIRSRRKTVSLQITPEGSLLVRAPIRMSNRQIEAFIREKSHWIETHLAKVQSQNTRAEENPMSAQELKNLTRQAKIEIPERTAYFADRMSVAYGRITIRSQATRWGSCSAMGNLNFNCLLMLAPPEVLDYVIVHELAHRKQMNHSARFWSEVETVLPDYRQQRRWLKEQGGVLMARMLAAKQSESEDSI